MITPVIVRVERQRESVEKLREYCYQLDGTELLVIDKTEDGPPVYSENAFHSEQSRALHQAAEHMKGEPFIWVEHDSIPLRRSWVRKLTLEYENCGKKFLLSSDHQPHDLVGGIGVYCGETNWLVPSDFARSSWDLWLIECVPHLVARTPLIQHSYCLYGSDGFCKEVHRFPRDAGMLRRGAVIFHRDPYQDLLGESCQIFS